MSLKSILTKEIKDSMSNGMARAHLMQSLVLALHYGLKYVPKPDGHIGHYHTGNLFESISIKMLKPRVHRGGGVGATAIDPGGTGSFDSIALLVPANTEMEQYGVELDEGGRRTTARNTKEEDLYQWIRDKMGVTDESKMHSIAATILDKQLLGTPLGSNWVQWGLDNSENVVSDFHSIDIATDNIEASVELHIDKLIEKRNAKR
jgi:hypothetical protein